MKDLPDYITECLEALGLKEGNVERLQGGINAAVFSVSDTNQRLVVKHYKGTNFEASIKMDREISFLMYCREITPGKTPCIITADKARHYLVMNFIEGQRYEDGATISEKDKFEALEFMKAINEPNAQKELIEFDAHEGYTALSDHMHNIHSRRGRLDWAALTGEMRTIGKELFGRLDLKIQEVQTHLENAVRLGEVIDRLDRNSLCISPSDFGFHNIIRTSRGLVFIDFEFAGWDDPAKAYVDFSLQPRIPVRLNWSDREYFCTYSNDSSFGARVRYLREILRVKWCCIVLGLLDKERLEKYWLVNGEKDLDIEIERRIIQASRLLET